MKPLRGFSLFVAVALTTASHAAETPASPQIPADVVAMLLEHRGQWRAEGWDIEAEKRTPVKAGWECKAAVNGVGNICTWDHEWVDRPHDSAVDIMGYDPKLNVLRMQRVTDRGVLGEGAEVTVRGNTMSVQRESSSEDGKPRVMRNKIVVTRPGEWDQHITFDEDGKRVREWRLTQRRVANAPVTITRKPPPNTEIPPELVAWLEGQRGTWRSEGVIVMDGERTPANATWECAAAVNGIGNVCTWHHEWTNLPADSAIDIAGYDPRQKMLSIARLTDSGILQAPVTVPVRDNRVRGEMQITYGDKPATLHNDIDVKSPDERAQRMYVEVDGKVLREFIITHRRVK